MDIVISETSGEPIYKQIYEQLCAQILRGELVSGDSLPPIRVVARELRISVITVKKAWEELERAGFIYTMAGKGCFVATLQETRLDDKRTKLVCERLQKELAYYRALGVPKQELLALVARCYDAAEGETEG